MQPVRLKSRAGASDPQTQREPQAPRSRRERSRGGGRGRVVLVLAAFAGLCWGGIATWLLLGERAAVAALRQEQAFLQSRFDEKERAWKRQIVGAILNQTSQGPAASGQDGARDLLAELIGRQIELETRQNLLGAVAGQAANPVLPQRGAQGPEPGAGQLGVNTLAPVNILDRLDPAALAQQRRQVATIQRAGEEMPLPERLALLQASLDRVDGAQSQQISTLGAGLAARVQEVKATLGELGLDVAKVKLPAVRPAMGGPFIPLSVALRPGGFEQRMLQLNESQAVYGRWRDLATIVPLQRPVDGDDSTTSNFGTRTDPFTGGVAMHAGMDFRAETGTPIRAAGAGKVLRTEVAGGYGNLVELDHGNGLTTRYGHLSAYDVKPGDIVAAGTVIGRAGSTGRSTGPHLHYETRHDDQALNPLKFILAGARLARDPTTRP